MRSAAMIRLLWLLLVMVLIVPPNLYAQSDWEFYFFNINLKKVENNWLSIIKGAAASLLIHELGHILYLESQGKEWKVSTSSSGVSIWSDDYLTHNQNVKVGRAGFALQTGVSIVLISFNKTKTLPFTEGWLGMNVLQLYTGPIRGNDELYR